MAEQRYRSLLFFGAPGVGKGTQGKVLGRLPGFFHVSSGDCFRALDESTPEGREVADHLGRGALVPDDLTLRVWKSAMRDFVEQDQFDPAEDVLILDGLPRNVPQAEILQDYAEVLRVIHLLCTDDDAMVARIKGRALAENRTDDADEDVIRRRFEVYRRETAPVLEFYRGELICEVDALRTPAEVLRSVLDCIIPVLATGSATAGR